MFVTVEPQIREFVVFVERKESKVRKKPASKPEQGEILVGKVSPETILANDSSQVKKAENDQKAREKRPGEKEGQKLKMKQQKVDWNQSVCVDVRKREVGIDPERVWSQLDGVNGPKDDEQFCATLKHTCQSRQ
jgi:hypothetical protein